MMFAERRRLLSRKRSVGGVLSYYGTAMALSEARRFLSASTVGNYALFAGGGTSTTYITETVDAYNDSLIRTTATSLTYATSLPAATTVGDYALFAGGGIGDSSNDVNAYSKNLTRTTPEKLSSDITGEATATGNYAFFPVASSTSYEKDVNVYDASLVRTSILTKIILEYNSSAAATGGYAIITGGAIRGIGSTWGYAIDSNLVVRGIDHLSIGRGFMASTTVGDYALFAGGGLSDTYGSTNVDVYNSNLVRITAPSLSEPKASAAATTIGNYAIIAGGAHITLDTRFFYDTAEVYDKHLVKTSITSLSVARSFLAATTVGNYGIFAGGGTYTSPGYYGTVDVYKVE